MYNQNHQTTAPDNSIPASKSASLETLRTSLKVAKFLAFFTGGLSITFLFRMFSFPGVWMLYWIAIASAIAWIAFFKIEQSKDRQQRWLIAIAIALSVPLSQWDAGLLLLIKPMFVGGSLVPFWQAAIGIILVAAIVGLFILSFIAANIDKIHQTLKQSLREGSINGNRN